MTGHAPGDETSDMVYGQAFVDRLPALDPHGENPWPTFVCKDPGPEAQAVRPQIEAWYQALPVGSRSGFASRLRDDKCFLPALAELYTHNWLRTVLNVDNVQVEPPLGKGAPDFIATLPGGSQVVCEVYSPDGLDSDRQQRDVADHFMAECRRRLPDGFILGVGTEQPIRSRSEAEELVRAIQESLAGTSPPIQAPTAICISGAAASLDVIACCTGRPTVVIGPATAAYLTPTHQHIRKTIRGKCGKFKAGLEARPLVVFAFDETRWLLDEEAWMDICYGIFRCQFSGAPARSEGAEPVVLPRQGGLFVRLREDRVESRHISAVVACRGSFKPDGYRVALLGLQNPFADHPLPDALKAAVPFWGPDPASPGSLVRSEPVPWDAE